MATSYVMKVSSNGQMSIPAEARSRWGSDRVVVVDLGDRIVVRPLPEDPVGTLRGKYKGRVPEIQKLREKERRVGAADERRR